MLTGVGSFRHTGIPNFWNVASNFPFLAALYPAWHAARRPELFNKEWEAYAWAGFFAAVAAVTAGSSYYHWEPNDTTLVRAENNK
eukprot:2480021-Pyramimonas_sp.AAC.2